MPASWPRSADRSQSAAPLPADSSPPRTLLVEPARIAPHPSSLRPPLPITRQMGYLLPDFYSGAIGLSGYFTEGFSLRRLQSSVGGSLLAGIQNGNSRLIRK